MKVALTWFIFCTFINAEVFELNTFQDMISASKKSLKSNQDNMWILKKGQQLLDIKDSLFQKELEKYYDYMNEQKIPIKFFKMPSSSMCNTVIKGQSILSIFNPNYKPKRNDLLVYQHSNKSSLLTIPKILNGKLTYTKLNSVQKPKFLKRCIAVGGDEIFIQDKNLFLHPHEGNNFIKKNFSQNIIISINNKLFIKNPYMKIDNGIFHDKNITKNSVSEYKGQFDFNITKIPNGTFFMMGDNREHSMDSRHYGSIDKKDILGKGVLLKFKSNSSTLFGVQSEIGSSCENFKENQKSTSFDFRILN